MSNERDNGLNLSVLKSSLAGDDFGLLDNNRNEIDSIASLDVVTTPENKNNTSTTDDNTPEIVDDIEEIEDELPAATPVETKAAPSSTTTKQTDLLEVFASNLAEKGIIKFTKEEFDKAEDKDAFFEAKVQEAADLKGEEKFNAKYSELPSEIDELVKLHKQGVPLYKILEADANISALEGIKLPDIESDVTLQKDILKELWTVQGFAKDKIEGKLKRVEDLGTLKDESVEGFDILLNLEKQEKAKMIEAETEKKKRADQATSDKLKDIETTINSSEEIIPGFKLTPEDKKTLIDGITKSVGTDKTGRQINALAKARIDDPKMDLKVAYFTLVLKGDLSKLENKLATKTTRTLKSVIDSQEPISGSSQSAGNTQKATGINKDVLKKSLSFLRRTS